MTDWASTVGLPILLIVMQYIFTRRERGFRRSFSRQVIMAAVAGGMVWAVVQTWVHYNREDALTWRYALGGVVWFLTSIVIGSILLAITPRDQRKQ